MTVVRVCILRRLLEIKIPVNKSISHGIEHTDFGREHVSERHSGNEFHANRS